jgi:hypothetical protein
MGKPADWVRADTQVRQRGEQTGLDTRVVHAVNDDDSTFGGVKPAGGLSQRDKSSAWEVRSQD